MDTSAIRSKHSKEPTPRVRRLVRPPCTHFRSRSRHDQVAEKIAKKKSSMYNSGLGPDVITPWQVIEVKTPQTIGDATRQLQGYRRPVYVVITDKRHLQVVECYGDTTIGVMDPGPSPPSGRPGSPSVRAEAEHGQRPSVSFSQNPDSETNHPSPIAPFPSLSALRSSSDT